MFSRGCIQPGFIFALFAFGLAVDKPSVRAEPITFAVIGDYGTNDENEAHVANLVKNWDPDFLLSMGDNNYGSRAVGHSSWESRIGQYYGDFIKGRSDNKYPLQTSDVQRFFPTVGNHDSFSASGPIPGYVDYFHTDTAGGRLPDGVHTETESYYDFQLGPVHFFAVDSDHARADTQSWAEQRAWLKTGLAGSTATWKFVYFHHAPFSSGRHGNDLALQWPFHQWGAHAVFTGHEHDYERLLQNGFPYFVVGTGGFALRSFCTPIPGSVSRYNEDFGAMRVIIDGDVVTTEFFSVDDGADGADGGRLIDTFTMYRGDMPSAPPLPLAGDTNGDGGVDVVDLNRMRNNFGTVEPIGGGVAGDSYPFDGVVDINDLNRVRNNFGAMQPGRLAGDTNFDGTVGIQDLNNVRNSFGRFGAGDTNDDGVVDITDLNAVRNNFGRTATMAIPEPGSLTLLLLATVIFTLPRR